MWQCWRSLEGTWNRKNSEVFWNQREVGVGGTLKVSEVRVGKTLRHLQSEKEVIP